MGGDGGVIANQRRFIRGAKDQTDPEGNNKEGKNTAREQRTRSQTCALTNEVNIPVICFFFFFLLSV
jgi:hypothetical protein